MHPIVVAGAVAAMAAPASPARDPSAPALQCPLDKAYDPDNAFARILRGDRPASRVYEDDRVVVIMPIEWDHPGHALVVPKSPVRSLLDMTPADMGHALDVAGRVGTAQRRALGATGFTVTQNSGRNQHVCHVHFHVIPNTPRATREPVPRDVLDRMADRLRAAFPRR